MGNAGNSHDGLSRPLELLGISDVEERAYRALLTRRMATASDIAKQIRTTPRAARRMLVDLDALGLATHTPKVPRVYIASPPEFTVTALIKQRQALLERARAVVPDLEEQAAKANNGNGHEPALELISNRAQLGVVLEQMYKSFRSEAMCFQRAPTLMPGVLPPRKLRAGLQVRTISDNTMFALPGMLGRLKQDVAHGEQARMIETLPFKMMIFDRRAAVLTLDSEKPEKSPTLLVHGGALLQALCLLFEFMWERATPIVFGHGDQLKPSQGDARLHEMAESLVPLLAAGLNDKAIAVDLGISSATLNRRIAELMRFYGTRSRFQLGWRAALDASASVAPAASLR
ncbi:MAG: helix-turn-helix domain-containing protein [Rhodanobacteraceae bacterium]